ncbi:DoxX family protein [Candidatus Uhrbacteria bacterium]|nr:MAG: DoxX family protein [Candidatus Uhrbacteria bacterium]
MNVLFSLHQYSDIGLLLLRWVVGMIFLAHGRSKLGSWKQPAKGMNGMMRVLSIAEPLGGVAMIFGFLTQPAALGLAFVMGGAIYFKSMVWKVPFSSGEKSAWEFDLLILAACLVLLTMGAGAASLDRIWFGL